MNKNRIRETLRAAEFFGTFPETVLALLVETMDSVVVGKDEPLFAKGDEGDCLYVITSGRMRIHDGELTLQSMGPGDVLGEMAVLDPGVRSAAATAEADTVLCRLKKADLFNLIDNHGELTRAILQMLSRRVRSASGSWVESDRNRVALEHELEIGREIQTSFLPACLPMEAGWDIAGFFKSARQVAGDFYDVFKLAGNKRIALVIGDVCDKGVGAALFMTLFRSLFRSHMLTFEKDNHVDSEILEQSLSHTNRYIAATHGHTSMYATMFVALLDPERGGLHYICAGHENPCVIDGAGGVTPLEVTGPAVGLFPGAAFGVRRVSISPGETLFAYTDGVVDAKDIDGKAFELDRLLPLLREKGDAMDILEGIYRHLASFMGNASQFDDITMFAVKREDRRPSEEEAPTAE